ncbi:MAG: hypothetical protein ACLTFB_01065 [Candidatus Phytoplasma pyri]
MFTLKGDVITLNLNDDNTKYLNELGREKLIDFLVNVNYQTTFTTLVQNYWPKFIKIIGSKNLEVFESEPKTLESLIRLCFISTKLFFIYDLKWTFQFSRKHWEIMKTNFSYANYCNIKNKKG